MSGIRTIEDVRERCRIDDITGCWNWAGAMSGKKPRLWCTETKRGRHAGDVLYWLMTGCRQPKGKFYFAKCGNLSCVNPEHRKLCTHSEAMKIVKGGRIPTGTRALMTIAKRRGSKLTPALVEEIRAADGSNAEIGQRYGVHLATAWRIRTGRAWAPIGAASVWTWGG